MCCYLYTNLCVMNSIVNEINDKDFNPHPTLGTLHLSFRIWSIKLTNNKSLLTPSQNLIHLDFLGTDSLWNHLHCLSFLGSFSCCSLMPDNQGFCYFPHCTLGLYLDSSCYGCWQITSDTHSRYDENSYFSCSHQSCYLLLCAAAADGNPSCSKCSYQISSILTSSYTIFGEKGLNKLSKIVFGQFLANY